MYNDKAIVSFILGIISLFVPVPFVLGIIAIIQGRAARNEIREDPSRTGDGFAVAGIVLGWVDVVMSAVMILAFILVLSLGLFSAF